MSFGLIVSIFVVQSFILCPTHGSKIKLKFFGTPNVVQDYPLQSSPDCKDVPDSRKDLFTTVNSISQLILFSEPNCNGPYLKYNRINCNMSLVNLSSSEGGHQIFHVRSWLPYILKYPKNSHKIEVLYDENKNDSIVTYSDVCQCINLKKKLSSGIFLSYGRCFTFYEDVNCDSNSIQKTLITGYFKGNPQLNFNNITSARIVSPVWSLKPCQYPQHCRILQANIQKFELLGDTGNQDLTFKTEEFLPTWQKDNPTNSSIVVDLQDLGTKWLNSVSLIYFWSGLWSLETLSVLDNVQIPHKIERTFLAEMLNRGSILVENLRARFSSYGNYGLKLTTVKFSRRQVSIKKNITIDRHQSVSINTFVNICTSYALEFDVNIVVQGSWGIVESMTADEIKAHLIMNDHLNLTYVYKLSDAKVLARTWSRVRFEFPLATVYNITKNKYR